LTWRRLGVLIDRLPPESATKTAIRDELGPTPQQQTGDDDGEWAGYGSYSNTDMHLGMVVDELRWIRYAVYHAQGGKPGKPHQYPRPGVAPSEKRLLSPAGRDFLTEMRLRRAAAHAAPAADAGVPQHIAAAQAKRLGPAERQWLRRQLTAPTPAPSPSPPPAMPD
jgi:hypothetical protein